MIYSINEEVPEDWFPIIDTFITMSEYATEYFGSPEIYEIEAIEQRGLLRILYKGGDQRIDDYAAFAREISSQVCSSCGDRATRKFFNSPRCENCT